jgi:hypothetical protein
VDLQRHAVVSAPALYSGNSHFGFPLKYLLYLWHPRLISKLRVSRSKCTDSAYLSCQLFILLSFLSGCEFFFFFLVCSSSSNHLSVLRCKLPRCGLMSHCELQPSQWYVLLRMFQNACLQNFKIVLIRKHLFSIKCKFVVCLPNIISARALRCCLPVTCLLKYIRQQMLLTSEYYVNFIEFQRLLGYFVSTGLQEWQSASRLTWYASFGFERTTFAFLHNKLIISLKCMVWDIRIGHFLSFHFPRTSLSVQHGLC